MAKSNVIDSLLLVSDTEVRVESRSSSKYAYFTMILFAMISIGLLLALLFGTVIYRSVNDTRADAEDERSGLAVMSNAIRYGDHHNSIKLGTGPEGASLVIEENTESGSYEERFYLYKGEIVQEYTTKGSPYTPSKATKIVDSTTFDARVGGNVVEVITDQGHSAIALRSTPYVTIGRSNG